MCKEVQFGSLVSIKSKSERLIGIYKKPVTACTFPASFLQHITFRSKLLTQDVEISSTFDGNQSVKQLRSFCRDCQSR